MFQNMLVRLSGGARLVMLPVTISAEGLLKALTFLFMLAVNSTRTLREEGLVLHGRTAEEERNDEGSFPLLALINSALDSARATYDGTWSIVPSKLAPVIWEMRDVQGGGQKVEIKKIQLIKQVRDLTGMGLMEAKKAVENACRGAGMQIADVFPSASTLPEDGYAILTCEHLGLREVINVPRDWRDGIEGILGAENWTGYKEATISSDIKYNKDGILFWYYECILSFDDEDLFRNARHFVDSCKLTEVRPLVYDKTGIVTRK